VNRTRSKDNRSLVCVVEQKRHGHLFGRDFKLPKLEMGERVVLQLAVTGHGWSQTTDQCGEYCHAVYRIRLNGKSAANVSQFRDDCKNNPINGTVQHGTWWESRNGWCPGTVEPGLFIDVTRWLQGGPNKADVDVVVWSNETQRYVPFTDYGGFALNDVATLDVGMSLFIYSSSAASAIVAQPQAFTAAEAAIRQGSSYPSSLRPPIVPRVEEQASLLEVATTAPTSDQEDVLLDAIKRTRRKTPRSLMDRSHEEDNVDAMELLLFNRELPHRSIPNPSRLRGNRKAKARPSDTSRYDFEARAPWYDYNETLEGLPDITLRATKVSLMQGALMQNGKQLVTSTVSAKMLLSSWGQAALHLKLFKPPGNLTYDHWDREASIGMMLRKNTTDVRLFPEAASTVGSRFEMLNETRPL